MIYFSLVPAHTRTHFTNYKNVYKLKFIYDFSEIKNNLPSITTETNLGEN